MTITTNPEKTLIEIKTDMKESEGEISHEAEDAQPEEDEQARPRHHTWRR